MARIIGVEVPSNKRIDIALRSIYGIGPVNAIEVLERANIDPSIRAKDLTEAQLSQIVHAITDGKYVIEGDLRRGPAGLEHVDARGALLAGHSMGGGAALLAAARDRSIRTVATLAAAETEPSAIGAASSARARR